MLTNQYLPIILQIVLMSGSGTSFFCMGEVDNREYFMNTFSVEEDVRVFEADFVTRESPDVWYFENQSMSAQRFPK